MARTKKTRTAKPIPPKSVVRLASYPPHARKWLNQPGAIFRIGYYSKQDGLDCIWLVNELGEYQETIDHDYLSKHFDIIQVSDEKSLYGFRRPEIGGIVGSLKAMPRSNGNKSTRTLQSSSLFSNFLPQTA